MHLFFCGRILACDAQLFGESVASYNDIGFAKLNVEAAFG